MWWVVSLFSRNFVHCDFSAPWAHSGLWIVTADGFEGHVVEVPVRHSDPQPCESYDVPVSEAVFWTVADEFIGEEYDWQQVVEAGLDIEADDRPGLICSELVAKMLIRLSDLTGTMQTLKAELMSAKPWGHTPREIRDIVKRHLRRLP
jgi:hypothetical protein